jgi:hypothetical protein
VKETSYSDIAFLEIFHIDQEAKKINGFVQ